MRAPPAFNPHHVRPIPWRILIASVALLACSIGLLARPARYRADGPSLSGRLTIIGSRGAAELVDHWLAIFRREHPQVQVVTRLYGSGVAAGAIADGAADVVPMTRQLAPEELSFLLHANARAETVRVGEWRTRGSFMRQPLILYVNGVAGAPPSDAAREFVRIALSREGSAVPLIDHQRRP